MNRLKELRQEKKLSQKEIALELQVPLRTYQRWENGESQIKPDKAQALAEHFGVSVGYLLGFDLASKMIAAIEEEELDRKEYANNNDIASDVEKARPENNLNEYIFLLQDTVKLIKAKDKYSKLEVTEIEFLKKELLALIDSLYELRLVLDRVKTENE